jgi:hypothetical protein
MTFNFWLIVILFIIIELLLLNNYWQATLKGKEAVTNYSLTAVTAVTNYTLMGREAVTNYTRKALSPLDSMKV